MNLPEGFAYEPNFLSEAEEAALLLELARLDFQTLAMHGQTARRRVLHYGLNYGTSPGS